MWFNKYGETFNTLDEAREDAFNTMTWRDYEQYILGINPDFFHDLWEHHKNAEWIAELYVDAQGRYFEDNYRYDDSNDDDDEEE